jgi:hypothetical protein
MSDMLVFVLIFLIAAWCVVLGERLEFETVEAAVFAKPARRALWVGSSYWGTRNRHPPTGHTPLVALGSTTSFIHSPPQCSRFGFSNGTVASNLFARQPKGVTADFWYPSMRRATPAAGAQRRPDEVSKLRPRQWSQADENGVTQGCNP